MAHIGKRIKNAASIVNPDNKYSLDDAMNVIAEYKSKFKAKFDESLDVVFKLGVDPKQSDHMVRGAVPMPNGLGKKVVVAVIVPADRVKEAKDAGADIVGSEELIEEIKGGQINFDVLITQPSMMVAISKLGKVLGPKGLMPNPKLGTVTDNIVAAIKNAKSGQVEYKIDKAGIIHAAFGKISFDKEALKENFRALYNAVVNAKPQSMKGVYMKDIFVSTTQGVSIRLDLDKVMG
jgi:large subunit ribosomal protein L1